MTFNNQLIDKFLDAIFPLPEEFGTFGSEHEEEAECITNFKRAVKQVDLEASIRSGISKIVITSPNLNGIVIKIPFNGYFYKDEENEDGDKDEIFWNPFDWAPGTDSTDYCLAEYEKYDRLKTYRLDCFVAKVYYYKTIDRTRVFLQEEVIPQIDAPSTIKKPSKKSKELAREWYKKDVMSVDPEWVAACIDKYGKSKVKRFLRYCRDVDFDILEDAHNENLGYRKNGFPCVLDYSNFLD